MTQRRSSTWQLGLLLTACAIAHHALASQTTSPLDDSLAAAAGLAGHCPAVELFVQGAADPLVETEAVERQGPCYSSSGDDDTEPFCVFTASATDELGTTTALPILAARGRASRVLQVFTDAHHYHHRHHRSTGDSSRSSSSSSSSSSTHNRSSDAPPLPPTAGTSAPPGARYAVMPVPGKGLGVVATGALARGDRVLGDAPALVVDHCAMAAVPQRPLAWLLNEAAARLSAAQRARILRLAVFGEGMPDPHFLVGRIYATSAYMLDDDDGEGDEDRMFGEGCGVGALFPEVSRMNHDCRPNAAYHFDPQTARMEVRAVRPIAAGEEITVSYISPLLPHSHRRGLLHDRWGFECHCAACTASEGQVNASDARLHKISSLLPLLLGDKSSRDPSMAQDAANGTLLADLVVNLAEEEHLDAVMLQPYRAAALEWNAIGERERAIGYAELAVKYGINSFGERNHMVRDMRDLVHNPEQHWSWRFRVS